MPPKRHHRELNFKSAGWSCPIHCHRCEQTRPNGARCKNRVCFGSPLCHQHNSMKYGVRIKKSTVPGAGKGLFATRAFRRDEWICPYPGEIITSACVDQRYPGDMTAAYVEVLPGGRAVDCACKRGAGSLANAHFKSDGTVHSVHRHNAVSSHRPVGDGTSGVWLKSRRNIRAGDEIFHWYGDGGYKLEQNHSTGRRKKVPDTRPCR